MGMQAERGFLHNTYLSGPNHLKNKYLCCYVLVLYILKFYTLTSNGKCICTYILLPTALVWGT